MSEQIPVPLKEQSDVRSEFSAFQNKEFSRVHSFLSGEARYLPLDSDAFGKASFLLAKMTKIAVMSDEETFKEKWEVFLHSEEWVNYIVDSEKRVEEGCEQKPI